MSSRRPKIGDAVSLWNFAPSPGFNKEELVILKYALQAYGVGRWVQILDTQLLPGKLIQQLNGQTQRLLGQQSLAAFTGLCVDLDRIREDNDKKQGQRKGGLLINEGPNPTKALRDKWQAEAKEKYGLQKEQIRFYKEELERFKAEKEAKKVEEDLQASPLEVDSLEKSQMIKVLKTLRSNLKDLVKVWEKHVPEGSDQGPSASAEPAPPSIKEEPASKGRKESAPIKEISKRSRSSKSTGVRLGTAANNKNSKRASKSKRIKVQDMSDPSPIDTILGMGFSEDMAKRALIETDDNLQQAVDWLMLNCVS